MTNISPSASLDLLNSKVTNDKDLRATNEGRHWRHLYGHRSKAFNSLGLNLASLLSKGWQSSNVPDGIEVAHVQRLVMEQANVLLQHPETALEDYWNDFIRALQPPAAHCSKYDKKAWIANGKPVVERIVFDIEALRTPSWNQNRNRRPKALPDAFRLQLWLLDYPDLATNFARGGKV